MTNTCYTDLAAALDRLPNGFPRTDAGTELAILERIFQPDEAALGALLGRTMEPAEAIAERAGRDRKATVRMLLGMARRGLVWIDRRDRTLYARLAPFVVGIYEAQLGILDRELAELVDRYFAEGGAAGIMGPGPALQRVIPVQAAIQADWILPYDDVRAILERANSFRVQDCICRVQQDHLRRQCDFPLTVCLTFSTAESTGGEGSLTRDEALALLQRTEEIGLVHSVSNVRQGVGYVCNCCGCCCGILRGITQFGVEGSMASANYYAVIDAEQCVGCGICIDRCQVQAIAEDGAVATVDRTRCIGCGLCVSGCPQGAARLVRKPEAERVDPPLDFGTWEAERLARRGLG